MIFEIQFPLNIPVGYNQSLEWTLNAGAFCATQGSVISPQTMKRLVLSVAVSFLSWAAGWYFFSVDCAAVNCPSPNSEFDQRWPILFLRDCCGVKPLFWFLFEIVWVLLPGVVTYYIFYRQEYFQSAYPVRHAIFLIGLLVLGLYLFIKINETGTGPHLVASDIARTYPDCIRKYSNCANMFVVDCNSPADGPRYYISGKSGALIGNCGGLCRVPGNDCDKGLCPPLRGRLCSIILGHGTLNVVN